MASETAKWALGLSDDDFSVLVASDCAGALEDIESVEALRETAVLLRWVKALDAMPSPDGKDAAAAMEARRAEAVRLLTMRFRDPPAFAAEQQARSARREARAQEARTASGYEGSSNGARKRAAGRTAVDRLVEAHRDEFARLLDQAHTELDVTGEQAMRVRRLIAAGLTWLAAEDFVLRKWPGGHLGAGVRLTVSGEPE